MRVKITHIISNLSIGGAQLLLFDIIKNLEKEEVDIEVITIDSGYYIEKFEKAGIKVYDLRCKGLINPLIFFKLKSLLKKLNPLIVHTHLLKADFYGRIVAKWLKIPIIFSTCHNDSTIHKVQKKNKKNVFDIIDNWVIDYSSSNIIAISEKVKKFLISRKGPALVSKISVIYNGIDIKKEKYILNPVQAEYFRNILGFNSNDFIVSIIGRLEEQKGHVKFLIFSSDLIRKYNLKILIIGEGSQRPNIETIILKENLEKNVFLIGFIDDTEKYFEISNLIVIPSLWEGFGIVSCEAMIKGKIVLASNVGGLSEIINNNINGFLYIDKELSVKLELIIDNYKNLDYIGINAIETIKNKFDIQKNTKLYYSEYMSKLNSYLTNIPLNDIVN